MRLWVLRGVRCIGVAPWAVPPTSPVPPPAPLPAPTLVATAAAPPPAPAPAARAALGAGATAGATGPLAIRLRAGGRPRVRRAAAHGRQRSRRPGPEQHRRRRPRGGGRREGGGRRWRGGRCRGHSTGRERVVGPVADGPALFHTIRQSMDDRLLQDRNGASDLGRRVVICLSSELWPPSVLANAHLAGRFQNTPASFVQCL
mmetsp:Transcript_148200/g.475979  ORF Transcript_148200/g.475979 Transcript_148200/m.475979 type:complete len:202 (+) Transcript_148200:3412-4017(+)